MIKAQTEELVCIGETAQSVEGRVYRVCANKTAESGKEESPHPWLEHKTCIHTLALPLTSQTTCTLLHFSQLSFPCCKTGMNTPLLPTCGL